MGRETGRDKSELIPAIVRSIGLRIIPLQQRLRKAHTGQRKMVCLHITGIIGRQVYFYRGLKVIFQHQDGHQRHHEESHDQGQALLLPPISPTALR